MPHVVRTWRHPTLPLGAVLATLLLLPLPCGAAEDGGARSVFSQGAGNRALGMGAAFVAIADDATATMWNPAGLGRLSRFELQAGQTSYFDLDVSESYLAVALPDWRWGAASATFRHFGVSGIERRDDRNVLLDGDLSDTQSEIGIGYGRPIGELWSFGAAFKVRRQSIAGLSGNGFGLDVGVTGQPLAMLGARAPWMQNLTWGLCLGNLVQPTLRLDRDNVADPTVVRTGVAYLHPLLGYRSLLAALDFEKAAQGDAHVHAGVELRIHPLFAVRAGLNHASMTAGTGFRWRDLALDYVYESNAVEPVHRFGLAYGFGRTTTESREAALQAEEEAIQSRLAEAFQKRQSEQIESLLSRAEERRNDQRWDEALELLSTVTALDTSQTRAAELEVECLRGKAGHLEQDGKFAEAAVFFGRALALSPADTAAAAGQLRCQELSDRHAARSAELRQSFQAAMDAFGADDLTRARSGFREILEREPRDDDAALMLRRTEETIARRVQSLLEQADRYVRGSMLTEAAALIDQASALDPRADGIATASAALARARQRAERAATEANRTVAPVESRDGLAGAPKALTGQKRKELELLYRRGLDAMKEKHSDDALRYWELVWSTDRNFQRVAEYLKREYLMRGMESFAAGRLDEAVSFWERALQVDPADQRARGYLARAQKQLSRTREILGNTR